MTIKAATALRIITSRGRVDDDRARTAIGFTECPWLFLTLDNTKEKNV